MKNKKGKKSSVNVKDLGAKNNPKGGDKSRPQVSDIHFTHTVDKSSPQLLKENAPASGLKITDAALKLK